MDYFALTTYLLVMIITPGPNNIMLTASGANFGYKATVPHISGIIIGTSIQTLLGCLGLGAIFVKFPLLHHLLTWVGIAYMLYLAWKMLGLSSAKVKHTGEPLTLTQAALFQVVNAKAWIIIATLATVFMPKTGELVIPSITIAIMVALITLLATNLWAMFGSTMRQFLKTARNQFIFNLVMAILLVITAIMIVVK